MSTADVPARAPRGGQDAQAPEAAPLTERVPAFIERHQVMSGVVVALTVAAVLGATFWFTIFSGLSSSADFIYSQF